MHCVEHTVKIMVLVIYAETYGTCCTTYIVNRVAILFWRLQRGKSQYRNHIEKCCTTLHIYIIQGIKSPESFLGMEKMRT